MIISAILVLMQAVAVPTPASPTDNLVLLCYLRPGTFDPQFVFTPGEKKASVLAVAFSMPKLVNIPAAPSTIYDPTAILNGRNLSENDYVQETKNYVFFFGPKEYLLTLMVSPPEQGKALGPAKLFDEKTKPMVGRTGACLITVTENPDAYLDKIKAMPESMQ